MTYQIPQQLEYKEKIMFGLTFSQLAYAFIFGLISLLVFKRIDDFYLKVSLIIVSSMFGIGFMFLNLSTLIKNYWSFLKFQRVLAGDPKLKRLIGIKSIEEELIITSTDKKVAILKVQPINFSIKPQTEKDAIIYSFQKFLNSLDFPTQIIMNTESINLDDYLSSLESKLEGKKFKELFLEYKKYIHGIITNNKLMNRVFYLVIPEQGNIKIQVDICIERLAGLNLKVSRLDSYSLRKLLLSCFSGKGIGKEIVGYLSPESIHNRLDYLLINKKEQPIKQEKKISIIQKIKNKWQEFKKRLKESRKNGSKKIEEEIKEPIKEQGEFRRIIYASGYPRNVEAGFLDRIVSALADFNLSIHIKPYPIERMLIDLNRELQKQRADLYSMGKKGVINPSLEIQYGDTRSTLENLQKGKERLFNIGLYISCKAESLEQLELLTRKVESELNGLMILPRIARLRMLQGFKSILPLGIDELKSNRNITTEALSAFFPFTSQFLQADNTGVWLGLNKNGIPIIKDIFKLPNPNGLVLAQSGGGKSYFCKLLIMRYLLNGTKVMIIDPQGEYKALVDYFEGQRIDLSRESKTMINPLDLMGHDYAEKRLSLMDLMQVMLGKMTEPQKSFIDKAITMAYKTKNITDKPRTWNNKPPILNDLLTALRTLERKASQMERTTITSLVNRLEMYVTGVFKFMNKHTNIEFDNKLVCFDIGNLPKQVKPAIMFLVLDYIYMKMKSDLSRKLLLIDESWSLLSRTEDAGYIFEIVKTCRKFNMGLLMINQEVEGLFGSPAGKSVLANSAYTLLMRQKPAVIDQICNTFNLSPSERQHLLTCSIGEGLLIMEDDHSQIKVKASDEEHKIITTNADELLASQDKNKQENVFTNVKGRDVKIRIDPEKGLYKVNQVSKDEREFLLEEGYKISEHKSITSNKYENYLLLPRFNESPNHFFVIQDIKSFLEKKGIEVETPTTKKPDVIFEINGKKYAIEVETGTKIKKDRKMIEEKVKTLKNNYDEGFFVITGNENLQEYKKIAKVIEMRYLKIVLTKLVKKTCAE
jgi:type IV secretory pathway VirB4 component